jgi:hypothetical protein
VVSTREVYAQRVRRVNEARRKGWGSEAIKNMGVTMPPEDETAETRDTLTQYEDFVQDSILEQLEAPLENDDVDPAAG